METSASRVEARALEFPDAPASRLPSFSPDPSQLDDLELLLSGALAPLDGYLDRGDAAVASRTGRLPDGRPAPLPLTLEVPESVADAFPGLVLEDPEGLPLAVLEITDRWTDRAGCHLAGPVTSLRPPAHGPFRRLRVAPAASLDALPAGRPVLGVPLRFPPLHPDLRAVREEAARLDSEILLLPLVGAAAAQLVGPEGLVRATVAAAAALGRRAHVVAVPLAAHPELTRPRRTALHAHVAAAYGATHVLLPAPRGAAGPVAAASHGAGWPIPAAVLSRSDFGAVGPDALRDALDAGHSFPPGVVPEAVETELRRARPPAAERGVTILFTGLSGSGKSTVARGVADALAERGDRTATLLDGDVVRRMLSAGLGFSRADRDLNVRRIGFVAAQISRHGGVALCAPIAPYAASRAAVRQMAEQAGEFVLVHVAASLEVCERRDRKGLYAKARAGLVPSFTGVSDPYEEPTDADLVLDTENLSPAEAVGQVLDLLASRGLLAPTPQGP